MSERLLASTPPLRIVRPGMKLEYRGKDVVVEGIPHKIVTVAGRVCWMVPVKLDDGTTFDARHAKLKCSVAPQA